ncbi:tripartite motif-containing 10 [Cricetulus griseus]
MASAPSVTSLADEVNCPICQGTLREPVTIDCGHNFCRGCLTRYCEIPGPELESLSCPLCKEPFRPGSFRPNWQLANVVENIERLQLASTQGPEVEDACPEHREKVYFFCEEDEAQLCVVCREAGQHRTHTVRFLEDAAGPYRTQVATKRQQVISQFAHLSQFLEEQQSVLLAQLERLDGDILKQQEEFDSLATGEICRFSTLIEELEEKNKRPARGLLTPICRRTCSLFYSTAQIALDPQTSHPKLLLSEDHRRARFSYKWQNSPDTPQRFDRATCVLAQRGFTGGRHTWVVNVDLAHGGSCTVGVAREDVQRKGELRLRPEEGTWAVRLAWGFVSALGSFPTRLALEQQPRKVQVSLDYEVGWVTFVNAVTQEHIYTFTASFTREIFPLFGLWGRGSSFSLSCQEGSDPASGTGLLLLDLTGVPIRTSHQRVTSPSSAIGLKITVASPRWQSSTRRIPRDPLWLAYLSNHNGMTRCFDAHMDSRCYHQFTGDMDIAQMTLDVMETSNAWPQGATAQAWLRKETVSKCQSTCACLRLLSFHTSIWPCCSFMANKLQEEVTCPICLEILQNPVTIDCGHNFCQQCIIQVGKTTENLQCPLCKVTVSKDTFRPNKQLASLAETIRSMDPTEFQPEGEEKRCLKHKEKFHYFCEQDGEFLCLVCRDSRSHKSHNVTLIDEADQNYKVLIESQIQDLGQKDKEIIEEKKRSEGAIQVFRAQIHLEKLKILEEFKHLHLRLEEEERFLLSRLDWLEHEGAKQIGQSVEFKFLNPTPVPEDLERKTREAIARHAVIIKSLEGLKDNLKTEGKKDKSAFLDSLSKQEMERFPVTLDAASADRNLTFSQDLKKATLYMVQESLNTQGKPRPFYPFHCVRGSPKLSSGRGVWEVEIQGPSGRVGMVGVATELALRSQSQNSGTSCLWALRISSSGCQPFTNCKVQENVLISLEKVGVYVDYNRGDVVFYDAITKKHIYTFQTSFDRQVFPLFGLLASCTSITLSP